MLIKVLEKDEEIFQISDLVDQIKKSKRVPECGAIFTFEGIVRGNEEGVKVEKLILTTPDKDQTQIGLEKIVGEVKEKFAVGEIAVVHYTGEFQQGDTLFLVAVLGNHRHETLDALKEVIERTKFELDFQKEEHTPQGHRMIMSGG